ncbi:DUF6082 family protein [Streptomyces scabiei]|uniref:DUF6082 family protein n=1 Tax=Streptomyces scabiei TaxID=1930 RepID=UPI0038F5FDFD
MFFALSALAPAPLLPKSTAPAGTGWGELSDISQIYSASPSAVALLRIAVSLAYQARQTATANAAMQRSAHRELILMSLDDPDLTVCWEPLAVPLSPLERKQFGYMNLIVSDWYTEYQLKRLNNQTLELILQAHFQGEVARRYWQITAAQRHRLAEASNDPRGVEFVSLADTAYARAVAAGPPVPSSGYFSTSR